MHFRREEKNCPNKNLKKKCYSVNKKYLDCFHEKENIKNNTMKL